MKGIAPYSPNGDSSTYSNTSRLYRRYGSAVPPASVAPLAQALTRLAADPGLRAALGAAGRARALARFDEAQVVDHTLDLLGL